MNTYAAYVFCRHLEKDPVAKHVLARCRELFPLKEAGESFDGHPVLAWNCPTSGATIFFAESEEVVSHDYPRYLPELQRCFNRCDFVSIVNWHAGANAPDQILCLHTTGDMPSGYFGAADPVNFSALFHSLRNAAALAGCNFTTLSEATHWSGAALGSEPAIITQFEVPVFDIEIGSSPASWSDETAQTAMAQALVGFPACRYRELPSILCLGGIHFESGFSSPLTNGNPAYNLSHILPNQWLTMENYSGEEGVERLLAAVRSIRGGVHAVAFHDNLKGPLKEAARAAARELGVPSFNHKTLRDPKRLADALKAGSMA